MDYLSSKIGHFLIPVVRNGAVGTLQDDRELVCIRSHHMKSLRTNTRPTDSLSSRKLIVDSCLKTMVKNISSFQ